MNIALIITIVLVLGVIFVNGWTDAPNAIATAVSTRVLSIRFAVLMAAVMNLLGALVSTLMGAKVATTIFNMVDFSSNASLPKTAPQVALAASLFAIVLWATAAWYFGIPTSESHALIAGLTGSAIALGGFSAVNLNEWVKVIYGLFASVLIGFFGGVIITKIIVFCFKNVQRRKTTRFFSVGQAFGAAANAYLHGAQDGQKFMGVFMLGLTLNHVAEPNAEIPIYIIVICALTMGFGTSIGGARIIKSVGMDMVKLETYQGFSADLSTAICIQLMTSLGIPVSTTHAKTTAIMGVAASKKISSVDWQIVKEMVLAWVLTFPGCGIVAFLMAKIFVAIF
ncbi:MULTISPECIES: inorganic phosphate transporter [unclassified Enterococcus]|uniref:inorganic phosphate transporter n=1 Tax=unclassified Enterococcus TaxID=2608891 RepID=UPI0015532187|nr:MULTISPECIES: inorganic phosphate transporter [unclassified Enterococcus]MBS7576659.1 inorganic phosphate transporter [Enterococcus sp. MMGLQ5-2]MBS7583854.1 inorganic phosphate transporter [Enterococcus sp. MMGLQ5-1]NPD11715.1 inorganic phosphate transporter [Enterococcus sp. MMGLQ5-1]NPD36496.1 inorganic phosphate transporter [Enterococcus sp. MMGLQ5-2]